MNGSFERLFYMKTWFAIIAVLIFFSIKTCPQEIEVDSVKKIFSEDNLQKLQMQFDEFEIYRDLNYMKIRLPATGDKNTIWMWTNLSISSSEPQYFYSGSSPSELIFPLYQQFIENSKLNPVSYILGMAQTAAVGYLAYRHIKKYGLFR